MFLLAGFTDSVTSEAGALADDMLAPAADHVALTIAPEISVEPLAHTANPCAIGLDVQVGASPFMASIAPICKGRAPRTTLSPHVS